MTRKRFLITTFIFVAIITHISLFSTGGLTLESSGLISRQIGSIVGIEFVILFFSLIISLIIYAIYGLIRIILDKIKKN